MGSCGSKAEAGVVAPTEVVSSKQGAPTRMKAAAAAAAEPPALPEAAAAGGYREQAGAIENQIVTGTPAVEPANDVIDWKAALEQVGDDEEFLRELLGDLVDELKTGVEVLEKAISEGDIVGAGKSAHGMKGGAANVMCYPLRDECKSIEMAGNAFKSNGISAEEARRRQEEGFERLKVEVERFHQFQAGLNLS